MNQVSRLQGLKSGTPSETRRSITRRQAMLGTGALFGLGATGLGLGAFGLVANRFQFGVDPTEQWVRHQSFQQPAFAIIPVVADGKWIWKDQPEDQTGYVDPRTYEISIGIEWTGTGAATQLKGATVAPVELSEQQIETFEIEKSPGCEALVNPLSGETGQLEVFAPQIERGQVISATAKYKMTLYRNCPGLDKESFSIEQIVPRDFGKVYLGNSPGIQATAASVQKVAESIVKDSMHPWEKAEKFHEWVWKNIEGRLGDYTSVKAALKNRVGDCEERATVFIALCRACGIPARMVWVPNHAWAEFCLFDSEGKPNWIPSHTAAYSWFGWTGVHELVLQKGDKIYKPQTGKTERLVKDWMSWRGSKPRFKFTATIKPVPMDGEKSVPGGRTKFENGKWGFLYEHPENKYLRD